MTNDSPVAPTAIVIMGVSGAGKSTVGTLLATQLGRPFADGDDFHPEANVAAMAAGRPLTDADRLPWLRLIRDWIDQQAATGTDAVITCSALKRSYRDLLRESQARLIFVHLDGDPTTLAHRIGERKGHFMPGSLIGSQFAALEPLVADEEGLVIDVTHTSPEQTATRIAEQLRSAAHTGRAESALDRTSETHVAKEQPLEHEEDRYRDEH